MVSSLPSGTKLNYSNNDHLGTPQVFTDQNQNVVSQANYRPFGEVRETLISFRIIRALRGCVLMGGLLIARQAKISDVSFRTGNCWDNAQMERFLEA